jgi:hypothetical protein
VAKTALRTERQPQRQSRGARRNALSPTRGKRPRRDINGGATEPLAEQAYRIIEEEIVTLALKPGAVIS